MVAVAEGLASRILPFGLVVLGFSWPSPWGSPEHWMLSCSVEQFIIPASCAVCWTPLVIK